MNDGPSISSMFMSDMGSSTEVAGNTGSSLMSSVTSMFTTAPTTVHDTMPSSAPMSPGQNLSSVLGNTGEVMQQEGSGLSKIAMGSLVVGGAFKLVDALSTPEMTPIQRQEYAKQQSITQEDQRKSGIMKEDAIRAEAGAREEKRKAFFAAKP